MHATFSGFMHHAGNVDMVHEITGTMHVKFKCTVSHNRIWYHKLYLTGLTWLGVWQSAPRFNSTSTVSVLPSAAAWWRAVPHCNNIPVYTISNKYNTPDGAISVIIANNVNHSHLHKQLQYTCIELAYICRVIMRCHNQVLTKSASLMIAPLSRSSFTVSVCPLAAAECSGVVLSFCTWITGFCVMQINLAASAICC